MPSFGVTSRLAAAGFLVVRQAWGPCFLPDPFRRIAGNLADAADHRNELPGMA